VWCGRCLDRRGQNATPIGVVEPDRTHTAVVDFDAEAWEDLFVRVATTEHIEVWSVVRLGRLAAVVRFTSASPDRARRSPYLRARMRTVQRRTLRLEPTGSSYELRCSACGARGRVSAATLREVARRALTLQGGVRIEPHGSAQAIRH
jgi:hypothetical protein